MVRLITLFAVSFALTGEASAAPCADFTGRYSCTASVAGRKQKNVNFTIIKATQEMVRIAHGKQVVEHKFTRKKQALKGKKLFGMDMGQLKAVRYNASCKDNKIKIRVDGYGSIIPTGQNFTNRHIGMTARATLADGKLTIRGTTSSSNDVAYRGHLVKVDCYIR